MDRQGNRECSCKQNDSFSPAIFLAQAQLKHVGPNDSLCDSSKNSHYPKGCFSVSELSIGKLKAMRRWKCRYFIYIYKL